MKPKPPVARFTNDEIRQKITNKESFWVPTIGERQTAMRHILAARSFEPKTCFFTAVHPVSGFSILAYEQPEIPADFLPAPPAPPAPMTEAEHNAFPKGRF